MRSKFGLFVSMLLAFAIPLGAQTTIRVPADQPTIQAGINAANAGDTVLVAPGTYNEHIDFLGKSITVTSSGGPVTTIIDGGTTDRAVSFKSGEPRSAILSGFTIQHGGTYGLFSYLPIPAQYGAIYISGSSPTIRNNTLTQNACWAIYSEAAAPWIQGNTISATQDKGHCNFATGAAVYIAGNLHNSNNTNDGSAALLTGNTIENNTDPGYTATGDDGGAAVYVYSGSPVIMNNIIRNNADPGGSGTAIASEGAAFGLAIVQNLIYDNASACGGGALGLGVNPDLRTGIGTLVANNTIVGNTYSGGANGSSCTPIAQIYPDPLAYGSFVSPNAYVFLNNIIAGSTSYPAVNCDYFGTPSESSQPSFENSILYNAGGPFFGSHCVDVSGEYDNISADPQFMNPSTGDFHLRSTSPAIDHGQNAVLQIFQNLTGLTLSTDFDGNPRVQDTTGKGCIIDMGAYEYPGAKTACATTETLTSSVNPSTFGQLVTFTAQLSSANGVPTGDVQFSDGSTVLGTESVSATGIATFTTSQLLIGSHPITAAYQPTGSFPAATANLTQVVNGDATTTTVTSSLNPSSYAAPVTFTAHVGSAAGSTTGNVTGSVTFTDGATALGTVTLDSPGNASVTTAALTANVPGTFHLITASYTPTGSFASSSASLNQAVNGLPTIASINPVPASATFGQSVILTTTVTPVTVPGPSSVTGTVTYFEGSITLGSASVVNNIAPFSIANLPAGLNTITCTYSGSAVYASSNCPPIAVTITGLPTATTLTASPNPAYQGQSVTLTAAVTATGVLVPTGILTFYDGATIIGTGTLNASGQATFTTTSLAPGTHTLTASFPSTGGFLGSASPAVSEVILTSGFGLKLTPSTITVQAGQTGTVAVTLTSLGNFAGPLALSFGAMPTYASAAFAPGTVTLAAGSNGTASLLLITSSVSAKTLMPAPPGSRSTSMILSALFLLPLGLIRSRRTRSLLCLGFAAVLLGSLSGCTTIRTPFNLVAAGSYKIPITATDTTGHSQTATLTLVITP